MPHKRNPILCERVAGMARLLRGYALTGLENVALWHERDISHSSAERVILPDATTALHYMLVTFRKVVSALEVREQQLKKNLELSGGSIHSQGVMLALERKGVSKEDAYRWVQSAAMDAEHREKNFRDMVSKHSEIRKHMNSQELDSLFQSESLLATVDLIFERIGLNGENAK